MRADRIKFGCQIDAGCAARKSAAAEGSVFSRHDFVYDSSYMSEPPSTFLRCLSSGTAVARQTPRRPAGVRNILIVMAVPATRRTHRPRGFPAGTTIGPRPSTPGLREAWRFDRAYHPAALRLRRAPACSTGPWPPTAPSCQANSPRPRLPRRKLARYFSTW